MLGPRATLRVRQPGPAQTWSIGRIGRGRSTRWPCVSVLAAGQVARAWVRRIRGSIRSNRLSPNDQGVEAADEADVPVSTIAFGTEDGTIFLEGQAIPVPPDLDAMRSIADATGGVFFEAESGGELEAAYEDLGSSIGFETEEQEITDWFVAAALGTLLLAGCLSLLWFARLP